MWTNTTSLINKRGSLLLLLVVVLPLMLLELQGVNGATVTWGQVNKYASTLYTQDVYLTRSDNPIAHRDVDVVFDSENADGFSGYTITAVHAYDLTMQDENGGDGGVAVLLNGGVGQQHATVRFHRHVTVDEMHFQLVIYGVEQ